MIAIATTERSRKPDPVDRHLDGLHASFWLSAALCYTALLLAAATLRGIGIVSGMEKKSGSDSGDSGESGESSEAPVAEGVEKRESKA